MTSACSCNKSQQKYSEPFLKGRPKQALLRRTELEPTPVNRDLCMLSIRLDAKLLLDIRERDLQIFYVMYQLQL